MALHTGFAGASPGGAPGMVASIPAAAGAGQPLFSFGVFADLQHTSQANHIRQWSWRTRNRYGESGLQLLQRAVQDWTAEDVNFIVNLGNLVEPETYEGPHKEQALVQPLALLNTCPKTKYHILGHHDLQLSRSALRSGPLHTGLCDPSTETPSQDVFYYHFSPYPGYRMVFLDLYEISVLGYNSEVQRAEYVEGARILRKHNPNPDHRQTDTMAWKEAKYSSINGGVSYSQITWLKQVLISSQTVGEKVIVCGHNPLAATEHQRYCFVSWSNTQVLKVLYKYECVVTYISGHDLDGGYIRDESGLHHLTLPGMVETPGHSTSHATLTVYESYISVQGYGGRVPSIQLPFSRVPSTTRSSNNVFNEIVEGIKNLGGGGKRKNKHRITAVAPPPGMVSGGHIVHPVAALHPFPGPAVGAALGTQLPMGFPGPMPQIDPPQLQLEAGPAHDTFLPGMQPGRFPGALSHILAGGGSLEHPGGLGVALNGPQISSFRAPQHIMEQQPHHGASMTGAHGLPGPMAQLPGHPLPGHPLPGHALPGHALPGHTLPGHPLPGHTLPGHPLPGHTLPGHTLPALMPPPTSSMPPHLHAAAPSAPAPSMGIGSAIPGPVLSGPAHPYGTMGSLNVARMEGPLPGSIHVPSYQHNPHMMMPHGETPQEPVYGTVSAAATRHGMVQGIPPFGITTATPRQGMHVPPIGISPIPHTSNMMTSGQQLGPIYF